MKHLLIVGCGDVASRALRQLATVFKVSALVRSPASGSALAARGIQRLEGDLDRPETLVKLAGVADCILHSAPPPDHGESDQRTRDLLAALAGAKKRGGMVPQRLVYLSTSGVYGDCRGEYVDETRAVNPVTARARRRLDAERALTEWCAAAGTALVVLRVPGIYAADRLPVERLKAGTPALVADEDVYTNHIHAEDLAHLIVLALQNEQASGVFNANDDTEMKVGDWLDLVADRVGLPRPPRVTRAQAQRRLTSVQWSFMAESRRLVNRRMKEALGMRLRYPTVRDGVPEAALPAV